MLTLAIDFGNQVEHGPLLSGCNFVEDVPECIFQAYAGHALIQADIAFEYQRFASLLLRPHCFALLPAATVAL
jgi:hypothetical protein